MYRTYPPSAIDQPSCPVKKMITYQSSEDPVKNKNAHLNEKPGIRIVFQRPCAFCSGDHTLELCKQFKARPHKNNLDFLRSKGACFGCLILGHMSKECKRRLTCHLSKETPHSTAHRIEEDGAHKEVKSISDMPKETLSALVSMTISDHTGAGKNCALSILPVQIKHAKGKRLSKHMPFWTLIVLQHSALKS